jgi:hypothetical protein
VSGRASIDYKEAERRFVIEGQSLRQIAADMGLKSNSSISTVARRDDWAGKRAAYNAAIARRSYEVSAAAVADQGKQIKDETILAGRATIRAYIKAVTEGTITPNARDAQVWAAWLVSEATAPADANPEGPDARNVTPPDLDELRRVVEAARRRVGSTGGLGTGALVLPANPRPD